jgi:hypothetical protein
MDFARGAPRWREGRIDTIAARLVLAYANLQVM